MEYGNKHKIVKYFFSSLLILLANLGIAGINESIAKEFFVAVSNGKDGNPGTKDAPFVSLEKGVSVLLPGDTLYVRGGTYQRAEIKWHPPSGTSWANAVTIKAYQNEKVTVKPFPSTKWPGNSVFYFGDNSHYIIMDGFTVDGTNGSYGYAMGTGSHHLRISNGEIKNTPDSGIQVSSADYNEFINLKVHDAWRNTGAYKSYGIYLNGNYNLVQGCEFYKNFGYGLHMYSVNGKTSYNRIINNKVHDNDKTGIGVFTGTGNIIMNNVSWNNERGIQVDYGATNTVVYHNTTYGNQKTELLLGPKSNISFVKNNLFVGFSSDPVVFATEDSGASEIENNLIIGGSTDAKVLLKTVDSSAITRQNLIGSSYVHGFKDPAKFDFHLTESSSAIGAGLVLTTALTDMDGVPRSPATGFDVGAYQYTGGPSLDPPTSLRRVNQ